MIERFGQGVRYHDAIKYGDILFLSGLTDTDAGDTIQLQAQGVLKKADALLEKYGSDRDHILAGGGLYPRAVRRGGFQPGLGRVDPQGHCSGARYLAVSRLGREAIRVEIVLTAAVK